MVGASSAFCKRLEISCNEEGIVLFESEKSGDEYRKELADYCEKRGIAGSVLVRTCSEEDLEVIKNLAQSQDLPELPLRTQAK